MGVQSVAILLRVYNCGIFSSHFHGYTQSCMATNAFASCIVGIVFPSGLTLMTIMMYIFRSRIKWNTTSLFILCGFAGWAFGGLAGTQAGWWGTNVYLHNTLNIVGHIHLVLLVGS